MADAKKTVAALEEKKYQDTNRIEIPPKPMGQPVGRKPQPGDQEIIDHIRGFILGTATGLGKSLAELAGNTMDPFGMGVKVVEAAIDTAVLGWDLTTDTKNTVNQIKQAFTDLKNYYNQASTEEKGLIEGELTATLAFIVQNKKVIIRNGKLAGSTHPVTGVPFDLKGFPIFESKFDVKLDPSLYKKSNDVQFRDANYQLYAAIQKDAKLASQFTDADKKLLAKGVTPPTYTWHHHQDPGNLQLVDKTIHQSTGHTGGQQIWGGGSENR
ncbi:hypothetical protein CBW65_10720 [Tumebacillus avium]|uniref:HNH endonuclease n=1 Tax=Tumebacillus avium TaxID=1903704 RepID=A0A1Y0IPX4_9BACL|nr:HNH endonuclease [Tumebacillus avium]ARU61423.1 hypothetical protein CBW65_10720 [Tumebacillus avium]